MVFKTYKDLMASVEKTTEALKSQILDATTLLRGNTKGVFLGVLHFEEVECLDVKIPAVEVDVWYVPLWGLKYGYKDKGKGTLYPNNNGSVMDLLRNSNPHGLPVEGSWFKAA